MKMRKGSLKFISGNRPIIIITIHVVNAGYEAEDLEHCGHVFSNMEKYDELTAIESSIEMVEVIRTYWMNQAKEYDIKSSFQENLKFISKTEIDANVIQRQLIQLSA